MTTQGVTKLCFKCFYCSAKFPDLKGLIEHFEAKHQNGEYIVIEVNIEVNDDHIGYAC